MTEKFKKFVANLWAFIKKHGLVSALVLVIGILILANIHSGDKHPQNQDHLVGESRTREPGKKGSFLKSKIEDLSFIYQRNLLYRFILKDEDYWGSCASVSAPGAAVRAASRARLPSPLAGEFSFDIDDEWKHKLLNGLDDIGITL